MARLEFFVISEGVSVDKFTNRLSLFNILEEVANKVFPFQLPHFLAVSMWVMEAGDGERDFQCMLRITMPNMPPKEFTTNFRFISRRHRVIQGIQGLPLNEPGMVQFEVLLNGEHAATHEVDVVREPMDNEGSSPPTPVAG
jgi:hypothetical protein